MSKSKKVLFVGESWFSYGIHVKGFNAYNTGGYEEGATPLLEALASDVDIDYMPGHRAIREFPNTEADLRKYTLIVFSDIGADTLLLHPDTLEKSLIRPNPLKAVADFVTAGGGFGMIGGYMSFAGYDGRAHYRNTAIAGVLPVLIDGADDRVELPEGFSPSVAKANHEVLSAIEGEWPALLGYNRLVAKESGTIVLENGEDPILVLGRHGKGRTFAWASDCAPHWGSPEFVNWKHYARFWSQLFRWTAAS